MWLATSELCPAEIGLVKGRPRYLDPEQMNLEVRNHNWSLLKREGATLLWEPFMVDLAVSWPTRIVRPSDMLQSEEFILKCRAKTATLRQYEDQDWSPLGMKSGSASAAFFFNFLRRAASQVANRLGVPSLNSLVVEEISSVVLEEVATAVENFRPGFKRGSVEKSWGFEAYLQNYSVKSACHAARKVLSSPAPPRKKRTESISLEGREMSQDLGNLRMLEQAHPESFSAPPRTLPVLGEEDCGALMIDAVWESVAGTPEAEVYLLHAVEGKTIRETSKILSISRGKCHRMAERAAQRVWESIDVKLRGMGIA